MGDKKIKKKYGNKKGYSRKNPQTPTNGVVFYPPPLPPGFPESLDPLLPGFPRQKTPLLTGFHNLFWKPYILFKFNRKHKLSDESFL